MLRKILFQIHLWAGLGIGLYVVAICASGSLLVFREEFFMHFRPGSAVPARDTERLSNRAIAAEARRLYPGFEVTSVLQGRRRTAPAEVVLKKDGTEIRRLFDPYDGADLGEATPRATQLFEQVASFHDTLTGSPTGRNINGYGAAILAVMCLTGMFIWWPGVKNLRRGLMVRWKSSWKRFNWDLHGMMGFWTFAFIFMWAVTSVYMIFPEPFLAVVDVLQPPSDDGELRSGDILLESFARVHFGRTYGMSVKVLWGVLGLVPLVLFVTGTIMWWNRKIRGWRRTEEGPYAAYLKTFFKRAV